MPGGLFWLQHLASSEPGTATSSGGGGTAFSTAVYELSPSTYFRLDETSGTAVADTMGVQGGTAVGSPSLDVTGYSSDGGAIDFDGSTQYVHVTHNAVHNLATNDYSLLLAFKTAAWPSGADETLLQHGTPGTAGGWRFELRDAASGDNLRLYHESTSYNFNTGGSLDDDAWHLALLSVDRSDTASLYIDGATAAVDTSDVSGSSATSLSLGTAENLYIAARNFGGVGEHFDGSLQHVAVFGGTALTASQFETLHDARNGTGGGDPVEPDSWATVVASKSPTAWWRLGESAGTTATDEESVQDGTYVGTPTLAASGFVDDGDTAVTLNGSSQYVSIADSASWDIGTSDFSVMCAFNISSWPSTYATLVGRGDWTGGEWGLWLPSWTANQVGLKIDSGTGEYYINTGLTLADGNWHLLCSSIDRDANWSLYIDGSLIDTVDVSGKSATSLNSSGGLYIGVDDASGGYLDGSIDEVAFWNGTLLTSTDWSDIWEARNS